MRNFDPAIVFEAVAILGSRSDASVCPKWAESVRTVGL